MSGASRAHGVPTPDELLGATPCAPETCPPLVPDPLAVDSPDSSIGEVNEEDGGHVEPGVAIDRDRRPLIKALADLLAADLVRYPRRE
jgi:hypothetical protein